MYLYRRKGVAAGLKVERITEVCACSSWCFRGGCGRLLGSWPSFPGVGVYERLSRK